jgi:hypothetical protein
MYACVLVSLLPTFPVVWCYKGYSIFFECLVLHMENRMFRPAYEQYLLCSPSQPAERSPEKEGEAGIPGAHLEPTQAYARRAAPPSVPLPAVETAVLPSLPSAPRELRASRGAGVFISHALL